MVREKLLKRHTQQWENNISEIDVNKPERRRNITTERGDKNGLHTLGVVKKKTINDYREVSEVGYYSSTEENK